MYPTKNDLPETTRARVIPILQSSLADAIDLNLQTKQAHWNVKGPHFIALHELFDKVALAMNEHTDSIAERIVQLGGTALGTLAVAAKTSRLPPYPTDIASGHKHVLALSETLSVYGKFIRQGINETSKLNDADSADLLTEVSRSVDQYLWFVEAHIQAKE